MAATPQIVLGTHTYAASGDAARRQAQGVASLRSLAGVHLVNVQFAASPHHVDGLATLPALTRDSISVTGRRGPRKPLVSDIFTVLANEARRRGAPYFAFTNADILVSQDAVDWIAQDGRDAYIFAREDFEPATGTSRGMSVYGADAFALSTACWTRHRQRFRGYILGEAVWDNVYAAVLLCHTAAVLENRRPLVRHEAHAQNWTTAGPFGEYQQLLAAYDATYFSLWCEYVDRLIAHRTRGGAGADEHDLARRTFRWPPPLHRRVHQRLRTVKAFVRYAAARIRG